MEDIPLGDVDDYNQHAIAAPYTIPEEEEDGGRNPVKAAAEESLSQWVEHYKMLMCKSVKTFHNFLLYTTWKARTCTFVDDARSPTGAFGASSTTIVRLFECDRNAAHGFYTLKAHAVLAVRPERLMYVIRDHNPETRLAWDSQYVEECKELESFRTGEGDIKVVMTRVNTHIPFIWPRHNLGIAWYGYDRQTQVYKYVFRSTQHRHYKCATDAVQTITLTGVIVRTLQNKQCELIVVVHTNPGNSFPSAIAEGVCKEWLRDRVHLYEKITKEWDKYYGKGKKEEQSNTKG